MDGVLLSSGARVLVVYASANRDECRCDNAHTFNIRRNKPQEQLAFGTGVHMCAGMHLARLEMLCLFEPSPVASRGSRSAPSSASRIRCCAGWIGWKSEYSKRTERHVASMPHAAAILTMEAGMIERPGAKFDHGTVEVFGNEVGHASAGSGSDVLVICPGSAGSDASWAKDMLSERLRVVELNPPGWGGTAPLSHTIDQRDLAIVLAAAIESLGISRYHLHGASMGGVTALWLAAQFPERVRSLSLEGGMNFIRPENLVSIENSQILADMVARNDPDGTGYPRAAPHPRKPWSDDDYIRGQMRKRIPMMRKITNSHEADLERRVADLPMPILVLLGDHDELVRPNHLDRWHDIRPDVGTLLVEGGAHDIQNTEPEQLVAALASLHAAADGRA